MDQQPLQQPPRLSTIDARPVEEQTRFPLLGATAGLAGFLAEESESWGNGGSLVDFLKDIQGIVMRLLL